ncbi:MAG: hypothetical protein K940chlam7_01985 [Chlamydiae bacterium]|nr:hypothetical protein [Chlamydiota bacterium]
MGVAVTICVRLISCAAIAPLKFYISFRCTNKTVEEDIFVRKTYVELQGQVPVLPNCNRNVTENNSSLGFYL